MDGACPACGVAAASASRPRTGSIPKASAPPARPKTGQQPIAQSATARPRTGTGQQPAISQSSTPRPRTGTGQQPAIGQGATARPRTGTGQQPAIAQSATARPRTGTGQQPIAQSATARPRTGTGQQPAIAQSATARPRTGTGVPRARTGAQPIARPHANEPTRFAADAEAMRQSTSVMSVPPGSLPPPVEEPAPRPRNPTFSRGIAAYAESAPPTDPGEGPMRRPSAELQATGTRMGLDATLEQARDRRASWYAAAGQDRPTDAHGRRDFTGSFNLKNLTGMVQLGAAADGLLALLCLVISAISVGLPLIRGGSPALPISAAAAGLVFGALVRPSFFGALAILGLTVLGADSVLSLVSEPWGAGAFGRVGMLLSCVTTGALVVITDSTLRKVITAVASLGLVAGIGMSVDDSVHKAKPIQGRLDAEGIVLRMPPGWTGLDARSGSSGCPEPLPIGLVACFESREGLTGLLVHKDWSPGESLTRLLPELGMAGTTRPNERLITDGLLGRVLVHEAPGGIFKVALLARTADGHIIGLAMLGHGSARPDDSTQWVQLLNGLELPSVTAR